MQWKERLVHLCGVSATERYGDSYYWGADIDGEPDTLWGLEGYTHPLGFFIDHISSDIFKREMALVDSDSLLRTQQGLTSPDYDLHHYDEETSTPGSFLKRWDDAERDGKTSHVAVLHLWAGDAVQRAAVLAKLATYAASAKKAPLDDSKGLQSCVVLRELKDSTLATLWVRTRTKAAFDAENTAGGSLAALLAELTPLVAKTELHQSASFDGHIGLSL